MIVPMIRAGVMISDKVVPDISVGKTWSTYWKENNLESVFGERIHYAHEYPDYYPQSKSNPKPSFAYPNNAFGIVREWLQNNYILSKFPKYLFDQLSKGKLDGRIANKVLEVFNGNRIEDRT